MERFGMLLIGFSAFMLLCAPADAQTEPVVKAWGSSLVVTAPDEGCSPADLAVRRELARQEVTFNFKDASFTEAVDFLAVASALNFVIHRDAAAGAPTVSLALKKVSVRTALEFLTRQVDLSWTVRDGVVLIGHKQDLVGPMRTSVHDVTDLLAVPPDFNGPEISIQLAGPQTRTQTNPWLTTPAAPHNTAPSEKTRAELMQELVDIVSGMLKAGTWDSTSFP